MPGGIQQVYLEPPVLELHYGAGNRNAPLPFNGHPVAGCVAAGLAGLYRAGQIDGPSEQKELFCESGLAGVGVADDGKGPAPLYFP